MFIAYNDYGQLNNDFIKLATTVLVLFWNAILPMLWSSEDQSIGSIVLQNKTRSSQAHLTL